MTRMFYEYQHQGRGERTKMSSSIACVLPKANNLSINSMFFEASRLRYNALKRKCTNHLGPSSYRREGHHSLTDRRLLA
jgi:hypothetical protein